MMAPTTSSATQPPITPPTAPASPASGVRASFVEGYQVRAGLRIPWDSNHERLSFSFFAVCDETAPLQWHGEVVFAGQVLHRTRAFESHHLAGRAAERALVERVVGLFTC
jgi:hypothetical protein